ncbi:hypothetical protein NQZ68_011009 [Dissostichus eleginoides]|nr:hypothetical protein NQZ68_011009 [Dissostichus eleginoides]
MASGENRGHFLAAVQRLRLSSQTDPLIEEPAEREDTRATHEGAYRASVSPASATTGQCAAAAQRPLCPTDTITIQDSRSPTSTGTTGERLPAAGTKAQGLEDRLQAADGVIDTVKV